MPEMTLEQAQERILALETELETVRGERDTLSHNNETLTADLSRARELNQKLIDRVPFPAPKGAPEDEPEDDTPSCEEFALTLKL